MKLSVDVRHRLGVLHLEAAFDSSGHVTALFGPSGAGKTTLVNMIGGLIRPQQGRIALGNDVLVDTERRVFVPPHRRRIGYVFQDARLFPHLSVRQNLLYGRFFAPAVARHAKIDGIVELLGIGNLLDRRPNLLSGGEKQRVAIGRALISSPTLLLMDEPLASLDDARKAEILPYLERLRDESDVPIVYVSHSVAEVWRLATDVVLLSAGKVAAVGPPEDILGRFDLLPEHQRNEAGAVFAATVLRHEAGEGLTILASAAGEWRLPTIDGAPGSAIRLRIRARDVMLATQRPHAVSALNILEGSITAISDTGGHEAVVSVQCGTQTLIARITRHSMRQLGLSSGTPVFSLVKAVTVDVDNAGGRASAGAQPIG